MEHNTKVHCAKYNRDGVIICLVTGYLKLKRKPTDCALVMWNDAQPYDQFATIALTDLQEI
jgi:hypothetical protein